MDNSQRLEDYDHLCVNILTGLATNAVDNIAASAIEILEVTCLFFNRDITEKMTAFNKLYASNSELDTKTDQINHEAERLVAAVQNGQIKKLTARAGDSNDLIEENTSISHLADIQKDLEAMIHQDEKIKQRLVPVMQCMQYEDLIINRIHRLIECWKNIINASSSDIDIKKIIVSFDQHLATENEYIIFYTCVLGLDYTKSIHSSLTKEFAIEEPPLKSIHELEEGFFLFAQTSLNTCIKQTNEAFQELIHLLDLISGQSNEIAYLFSGKDTLKLLHDALRQDQESSIQTIELTLQEIMNTQEKHNKEAKVLLNLFLTALQSQDAIRQNIENIGHLHNLWRSTRESIKHSPQCINKQKIEFGEQLMKALTSERERDVVRKLIPDLKISANEDNKNNDNNSGSDNDNTVLF